MDEGSGEVARDRSPNGFHGTRCGASWAGTPQPPITKRLDELEAKLGACSDCASKLAEHDKQLKALEEAAKQCGACASKLVELTNAGVIAERKAAEQEQKLIELERRIAELAAKAAQCAACEDRAVVQARLIAELSARVDDLTRKLADKTEPPEPADDLQRIEGIGPKIAEELKAAGIRTLKQLAATEVAELHKILKAGGTKYAHNDPASWPKQAQLLVAGKVAELTALQDSLRAGRPKP